MRKTCKKMALGLVTAMIISNAVSSTQVTYAGTEVYKVTLGTAQERAMTEAVLEVGEVLDLNFYGVKDWNQKKANYKCKWSADSDVVKVTNMGVVTAVKEGSAEVKLSIQDTLTGVFHDVIPVTITVPAEKSEESAEEKGIPAGAKIIGNLGNVTIVGAENGIIFTRKDGLYGAVNYDGKVLVPNEYEAVYDYPNRHGYFALESDYVTYFFDKNGTMLADSKEFYSDYDLMLGDTFATGLYEPGNFIYYNFLDGTTKDIYGIGGREYDFANMGDKLIVQDSFLHEEGILTLGEMTPEGAKYIGSISEFYESAWAYPRLYNSLGDIMVYVPNVETGDEINLLDFSVNAVPEDAPMYERLGEEIYLCDTMQKYRFHVSDIVCKYTDLEAFPEFDMESFDPQWSYSIGGFYKDGRYNYNVGKQMVLRVTAEETFSFLLDFENAVLDENNFVTNIEDIVIGKYDDITLSPTGYYTVKDDGKEYFIDKTGKVIGQYEAITSFADDSKYALVIKEDGMAYFIDTEFNELPSGYYASSIGVLGDILYLYENDKLIMIAVGEIE